MPNDALSRASDPGTPVSELLLLAQDSLEVARAVAGNPAIDEATASVLSGRRNARIDRALAGNPSTPSNLLVHLGEKHADLVLGNPSFEFLLAADPSAMAKIPDNSLRQLASSESVDPRCLVLMARMVKSASVAQAILENPRAPGEALRQLAEATGVYGFEAQDIHWHVQYDSAHRCDWQDAVEAVVAKRVDKEAALLEQLARAGAIDCGLRAAAVRAAGPNVRAIALARSPLPESAAHALAEPEIEDSRRAASKAIASRGVGALQQLGLRDPEPVLSGVKLDGPLLAPQATATDLLDAVKRHVSWTVSNCTGLGSPYPDMRPMRAVVAHPRIDIRALEAMVDAPPFAARFAKIAAECPAATADFLRKLSQLPDDPTVGEHWYTERPREGTTSFAVIEAVASNPACPPDILSGLLSRGSPALDRAIARNRAIGPDLAAELARRPDEKVRAAIAGRHDLTPELVQLLGSDHSKSVKAALAASLSVTDPAQVMAYCTDKLAPIRAAAASRPDALPDHVRAKLLADKSAEVRGEFASRGDLSAAEQDALASDASEKVRAALAANPCLLPAAIAALAHDASPDVATALAGNPQVDAATLPDLMGRLAGFAVAALKARGAQLLEKSAAQVDLGTVIALASAAPTGSASLSIALSHPRCPELVLRKRAKAGEWVDRALIASNPATPEDLRAELRADWAWPVVAAANAAAVR